MILWEVDPIRDLPDPKGWHEALGAADFVLDVSMFGNASGGHADVVLPAQGEAEKEGTVTHPDGRLQRLRSSLPAPGAIRPGWQVLAELSARLGDETGIDSAPEALEVLASDIPFYAGLTHEEIGGHGVRWQDRDAASAGCGRVVSRAFRRPDGKGQHELPRSADDAPTPAAGSSAIRIGTYRDLWAGEVSERNPALRFLAPSQTLELAPEDAERLGVAQGEQVDVALQRLPGPGQRRDPRADAGRSRLPDRRDRRGKRERPGRRRVGRRHEGR